MGNHENLKLSLLVGSVDKDGRGDIMGSTEEKYKLLIKGHELSASPNPRLVPFLF